MASTATACDGTSRLQAALRLEKGPAHQDNDLVLCENDGRPRTPNRFSAQWHKVVSGRGQTVRFNDVRHARATLPLRQRIHSKAVPGRLGHSTVNITLDTYSRVMPDMQDEAAETLNGVLKAAMGVAAAELKGNCPKPVPRRRSARLAGLGEAPQATQKACRSGGGGGIRTHERVAPLAVFKTAAFDLSATPPRG